MLVARTQFIDGEPVLIPSVELSGPRSAKVLRLDGVLAQLQALRRARASEGSTAMPSEPNSLEPSASRNWWLAVAAVAGCLRYYCSLHGRPVGPSNRP
jgi:hypothetical protein